MRFHTHDEVKRLLARRSCFGCAMLSGPMGGFIAYALGDIPRCTCMRDDQRAQLQAFLALPADYRLVVMYDGKRSRPTGDIYILRVVRMVGRQHQWTSVAATRRMLRGEL